MALIACALVAGVAQAAGATAEDPCHRRSDFSEHVQPIGPLFSAEQAAHGGTTVSATFAMHIIGRNGELKGVMGAELLGLGYGHQLRERHGFQLSGGEQEALSPVPLPEAGSIVLPGLERLAVWKQRA